MAASREERGYRKSMKRCTKGEARTRLFEELIKKKIGLREVEEFVINERKTSKGELNKRRKVSNFMEERGIVVSIMRKKLRGNNADCIKRSALL